MKKIACLILFCCVAAALFGQKDLRRGNEAFEQKEYFKASSYYESLLKDQYNAEAAQNLAHCYRHLRQTFKAERWYKKVLEQGGSDPLNALYLAQVLHSNGKSTEASEWARRFAQSTPDDPRGRYLLQAIEQQDALLNPEQRFAIKACAFNLPENDEFAPFLSGSQLIFTSDRGSYDKTTGWSGRSYTRLFQADRDNNEVQPTPGNINSQFHDAAACISSDGQTMYFTRNNVDGKKKRSGSDHTVHLIIVMAERNGSEWQLTGEFPYNSVEYNVAYPALSTDGKMLVFASDKPGGLGGMDLYVTYKNNLGAWGEPLNLGPEINTPGAETFPFLLPNGNLVFSSDGLPGLGGQDLFRATKVGNNWKQPENLCAPLNSPNDEFGFCCNPDFTEGWFSSNRNSPQAIFDLYYFNLEKEPNRIIGMVVDKYTKIPLKEVEITATDRASGQVFNTVSADDGQFRIDLPAGQSWDLVVNGMKNGIATSEGNAAFHPDDSGATAFVQLEHNDPRFTLEGFSLSSKEDKPIEGTLVKLLNTGTGETKTAYSGKDGKFSFQLEQKSDYIITGEKNGYYSTTANASTRNYDRSTTLYVNLFLYTQVVIVNEDIPMKGGVNPMGINDIYYDFDKWDIRPDAAEELDKLVSFLNLNSNLKVVQLSAHTDSRGSRKYNQELSQKRAESAVNYLISKGIARSRLRYQGYGETRLVNRCEDGITCSETEHQQNRRTELRVLELEQ